MTLGKTGVKLLIFDLGGVVFAHSFDRALEVWARKSGLELALAKKRFAHDDAYARHEVDAIGIEAYKDHVCQALGMDLSLPDFIEGWNAIFLDEIEGAAALVDLLSQTYPVVALSNTNRTHCDFIQTRFARVLGRFKTIYYSHEIGERKPDRGAYQRVLADYGISGDEAVFLDDLKVNLEGARALGIRTIHVTDFAATISGLEAVLPEFTWQPLETKPR